jgi:hypothetical protein
MVSRMGMVIMTVLDSNKSQYNNDVEITIFVPTLCTCSGTPLLFPTIMFYSIQASFLLFFFASRLS